MKISDSLWCRPVILLRKPCGLDQNGVQVKVTVTIGVANINVNISVAE